MARIYPDDDAVTHQRMGMSTAKAAYGAKKKNDMYPVAIQMNISI
jgi:hypothetical protein